MYDTRSTLLRVSLLSSLALSLQGCLCYRSVEWQWTLDESPRAETNGRYKTTYTGLGAAESQFPGDDSDFRDLLYLARDERAVLDWTAAGMYVKERRLWIERGELFGSHSGLFTDAGHIFHDGTIGWEGDDDDVTWLAESTGYTLVVHPSDGELIESNGHVAVAEDSAVIRWAANAKTFRVKRVLNADSGVCRSLADSMKSVLNSGPRSARKRG